MIKKLRKPLKICAGLSVIVILYLLIFDPITTTFNVTAKTERIEIRTLDDKGSQLHFYGVDVFDHKLALIIKNFNGSLQVNKGTLVTVERTAFGPAVLTFESTQNNIAGTLFNFDSHFIGRTGHYIRIIVNNLKAKADSGQTTVLPIDGKVGIGRTIDFETYGGSTAVLNSGQINMTGNSILSGGFEAGTTQLYLGDQIIFDDQSNKAFGFITINELSGMQVAYRVIAKQATILKPGPKEESSSFVIQATILDRLLKASILQYISLFFGVLVALTTLLDFTIGTLWEKLR